MAARRKQAGYSLIELLVVIGLIALMTGIAIPIIARTGLFTSNSADLAARELFSLLRAAKVYSGTYNVDTAIAYSVSSPIDSRPIGTPFRPLDGKAPVLDGYVAVRKLSPQEFLQITEANITLEDHIQNVIGAANFLSNTPGPRDVYVPIEQSGTRVKLFARNTCVLTNDIADVEAQFRRENFQERTALSRVVLFDPLVGELIRPRFGRGLPENNVTGEEGEWEMQFPAHIFTPTGEVRLDGDIVVSRQRIALNTGLLPDSDYSERFILNPDGNFETRGNFDPDNYAADDNRQVGIESQVILYLANGRVRVES